MIIIILLLILNLCMSIIFVAVSKKRDWHTFLLAAMFLAVPVLGMGIYCFPYLIFKMVKRRNFYDKDDLIAMKENEVYVEKPRVQEELDVIPLEEALVIGKSAEKRKLLLTMLKKDMQENYKIALPAIEDQDSETSHYAASAAMEMYRKQRMGIQEREEWLRRHPEDQENRRQLIDSLREYIESGVLSERDRLLTTSEYVQLIKQTQEENESLLTEEDFITMLHYMVQENNLFEAEKLAEAKLKMAPGEKIYRLLLEIYYQMNNRVKFDETLSQLQDSDIKLSAEGVDMIRFWIDRG